MNEEQREVAERLIVRLDTAPAPLRDPDLNDEAAAILRELLAEPQGEPVAWLYESKSGSSFLHRGFTKVRFEADMRASKEYPDGHTMTPLYTHPPQQRQPLTDKEIIELPAWDDYMGGCITLLDFARAVEKAHSITGEQE